MSPQSRPVPIQLRPAMLADAAALVALDTLAAVDPLRASQIHHWLLQGQVQLAQIGAQVVGYRVLHQHFFGEHFIAMLMVAAAHRRHGAGAALLAQTIVQTGTAKLFTSTNASNTPMQRLLQAHGFLRCGVVHGLDDGDPEWIFRHVAV